MWVSVIDGSRRAGDGVPEGGFCPPSKHHPSRKCERNSDTNNLPADNPRFPNIRLAVGPCHQPVPLLVSEQTS